MKDCFFLPGSSPQKDPHVWAGKLLVSREGSLGIPSQIVWVSFLWGKDLLGLLSPMGCFKYLGCPSKKEGALQESFSMNFLVEKLTIQHCDGPPYLLTHPLSGKTPTRSPWTAQRAHRNLSHPKRNAKRTPFKKLRPQDWRFVDLRWSLTLQWHFSGSAPSLSKTPWKAGSKTAHPQSNVERSEFLRSRTDRVFSPMNSSTDTPFPPSWGSDHLTKLLRGWYVFIELVFRFLLKKVRTGWVSHKRLPGKWCSLLLTTVFTTKSWFEKHLCG